MDTNRQDQAALRERVAKIRCFALDMDGTFYLGNRLLDGSLEFLRRLGETGRDYVFLTNNSSKSRKAYLDKLEGLGVPVTPRQLVTSGQAAIAYLKEYHPGQGVYLLGNESLAAEFREAGIPLEEDRPAVVVTAYDTSLTYQKLVRVCALVREGLPYLATHPDLNCPSEEGPVPDLGSFHALIHASAGRTPDVVIGKPNRYIIQCALEQTGHRAEETAMVGDRLYTDVAAAGNVPGLTGILVFSGETTPSDLEKSEIRPHLVFDSLADITPLL